MKRSAKDFEKIMKENNCYFLNKDEIKKLSDYMFDGSQGQASIRLL